MLEHPLSSPPIASYPTRSRTEEHPCYYYYYYYYLQLLFLLQCNVKTYCNANQIMQCLQLWQFTIILHIDRAGLGKQAWPRMNASSFAQSIILRTAVISCLHATDTCRGHLCCRLFGSLMHRCVCVCVSVCVCVPKKRHTDSILHQTVFFSVLC